MKTPFSLLVVLFASSIAVWAEPASRPYSGPDLRSSYLRCEYLVDPVGIDVTSPRLSWVVESGARGQRQTACRVIVASGAKALAEDRGDLWDTGRQETDETIGVEYRGKPLASYEQCFWKVKVWDKAGHESPWSEPAAWSMGMLNPADWKAEWIGYDAPRQPKLAEAQFDGAKWIWHAADEPGKVPMVRRLLVNDFSLPDGAGVKRAELLATADDGMRFVINGHQVLVTDAKNDSWRVARNADVTAQIRSGANQLRVLVENAREGSAGLLAKLLITTDAGQIITVVSDGSWKSAAKAPNNWQTAALDTANWPPVRVIGGYGIEPWGNIESSGIFLPPATILRTNFRAGAPVVRATLYATALGLVDMHLNGRRVSDDNFTPGWTDYAKRVYYRAYDVTKLVRRGENALGAVLADGWYSGYLGYRHARDNYGKKIRVLAQLHIEYADGSTEDIGTGPGWKASTGPILHADFLMGETYDARLERAGWDTSGCNDGDWSAVDVGTGEVHPVVEAHPGPPVRVIQEFTPKQITEPEPGTFVLDLGQNFAGAARLRVSGKPGQTITLRYAERLKPDGNIYTANLRSARATDTYVCKGHGVEIWQPRFTFHGFQYVEVTGLRGKPAKDTVTGLALSSAAPTVGTFECSDPMLNQLQNNICWTQRANFIDIPTDCPQRDERLGWTGDAQVYVRTATLNADVEPFYTKWLVDLEDAQRADGQFPCVAPLKVSESDGGPAWADAGVICPWTIYSVYGDRRELEQHYAAMTRFIEFCRNRSTSELLPPKDFHCFGDWLSIRADTPKEVIYTAYFAYSTHLTARAAEALGKTDDAAKYNELFDHIRAVFNRAYVGSDGRIKGNTQACYVLALAFDLVQDDAARKAAQYLVEDIEHRGWHLSTGFIGTKDLMLVLTKIGRPDVAYRLLHNTTFPSWGFSIEHGATSIWERWDGWTPEKGFQDPGMNSFAHYSFGAVYQWMAENIGGIRSAAPSYKEIFVAPEPDAKLTSADVSYRSIRGMIATDWRRDGNKLLLDVTIPANTTATLALPAASEAYVTESGHVLNYAPGVKLLRVENGKTIVSAESGKYAFSIFAGN